MKTEMAMLPNGNYEEIISAFQHKCHSKDHVFTCVEYGFHGDLGNLYLKIDDGDPYEDGYSSKIQVNYCPFCGYHPEKIKSKCT